MSEDDNGRDDSPKFNPYARDKRVAMSHRVYEGIARRIADLSEALQLAGYQPRVVSQAELVQAILWRGTPQDTDEAGQLLEQWARLKGAPPAPADTT